MDQPKQRLSALKLSALASIPLLTTAIVFWQGSVPAGPSTPGIHDKIAHFIVFGGLAVLCLPVLRAIGAVKGLSRATQSVWCVAYATVMGGLLELWQATLPHRSAEWLDFLADASGAAVAIGLLWLLIPNRKH